MKIKVAILLFNPFIHDSRVLKESLSLSKNNFDITVVAHNSAATASEELLHGIKVIRYSYLDRRVTKSVFKKLKAYMLYTKKSVKYCKNFDILHCNDLNTLPIGFLVKKLFNKNVKIVYDAHEYEVETNNLSGIKKFFIKGLENFFIRYADKVITVSSTIADEYVKLYNIKKPSLLLNTPKYQDIVKKDILRKTFNIEKSKTIFLYQGNLGLGRGIKSVIDTFEQVSNKNNVIVFMGYGPLQEFIEDKAKKYDNIYFHKAVSPNVLLEYTSSADVGIATIEDTCLNYRYCLPNKMFEYLMADIPIIVSNLPEMKKVIEVYEVGIIADDNTNEALEKAINEVVKLDYRILSDNITKAKKVFNWEEQEKVLLRVYTELAPKKSLNNE